VIRALTERANAAGLSVATAAQPKTAAILLGERPSSGTGPNIEDSFARSMDDRRRAVR